jgi:hypothetical protein
VLAAYTKEEILSQLDDCARGFTFPMLDNGYVYLADARLSAYRDETRWALIIEVVGYNPRAGGHGGACNCLHCFGNCLRRPPGTANEDFLCVTDDGPDGPTFDDENDSDIREGARTIRIRDSIVLLDLAPEALTRKGIEPEDPPQITGAELLRGLVPEHRDLLLATEEELRGRVPPDLPLVLRLDAWHHPDLAGDELPSESETFKLIADVLVSGNPSNYRPTEEPNTHWKNWPEAGSL